MAGTHELTEFNNHAAVFFMFFSQILKNMFAKFAYLKKKQYLCTGFIKYEFIKYAIVIKWQFTKNG